MQTFRDDNLEVIYYVVYLEPSQFVIVSADDLIEPIIAFSPATHYDPSPKNPLGALVSNDLPNWQAVAGNAKGATKEVVFQKAKNKWDRLQAIGEQAAQIESGIPNISDERVPRVVKKLVLTAVSPGAWPRGTALRSAPDADGPPLPTSYKHCSPLGRGTSLEERVSVKLSVKVR